MAPPSLRALLSTNGVAVDAGPVPGQLLERFHYRYAWEQTPGLDEAELIRESLFNAMGHIILQSHDAPYLPNRVWEPRCELRESPSHTKTTLMVSVGLAFAH